VDELKRFLSTPRGRVFAGAWGAVVLGAIVAFLAINLTAGTGSGAIKTPLVRPLGHPASTTPAVSKHPGIASTIPPALAVVLIDHEIAVIEVYDPGQPRDPVIDDAESLKEAIAGAKQAGAGFAAVDVNNDMELQLLSGLVTVTSDPYLFILDRAGHVLFQRPGYLDADTVAQAAANALIGAQAEDPIPAGPSDGMNGPYDGYWKAKVDQVLCAGEDASALLRTPANSFGALASHWRAEIAIGASTLAGFRSVQAIGPDKGAYATMVATYGDAQANQAAGLAALLRKPPSLKAFNAAMAKATLAHNDFELLAAKLGLACFASKKP
jgi:hypothetical protein